MDPHDPEIAPPPRGLTRNYTLPERLRNLLRVAKLFWTSLPYRGEGRFCPVCEKSSRAFGPFGVVPRSDAQCMRCGALERHRLVWLAFQRQTDLFDGRPKKMLHVAPEACFQKRLARRLGAGYVTTDLANPRAQVRANAERLPFPDQAFDVLYCSHVLQYVPDDRAALREFHRVLRPKGWAVFIVPLSVDRTRERGSTTDPAERERLFGDDTHARRYGPDFADRLAEGRFAAKVFTAENLVPSEERERLGLAKEAGHIFLCEPDESKSGAQPNQSVTH